MTVDEFIIYSISGLIYAKRHTTFGDNFNKYLEWLYPKFIVIKKEEKENQNGWKNFPNIN